MMLTSVADKDKVVKGLAAGVDDYLTKSFHAEELLARVKVRPPPAFADLLSRADRALYAAKQNGRNRAEYEPSAN